MGGLYAADQHQKETQVHCGEYGVGHNCPWKISRQGPRQGWGLEDVTPVLATPDRWKGYGPGQTYLF